MSLDNSPSNALIAGAAALCMFASIVFFLFGLFRLFTGALGKDRSSPPS